MAGSGDQVKALVRSHAAGDEEAFYSVALQVAAHAARQGHHRLADDLKTEIEASRKRPRKVVSIAQPRGDLSDLVTASHPDVGLKDMVLADAVSAQIHQVLREQRMRKQLLDHGFAPAHRLLLEGPPGTGKTMTASVLAHELSLPLLTIRLDGVMSKYLGESASKLRLIFDEIEQQRGVYLFDEFDALGADRMGNDVGEARRILNSFLVFLDDCSYESIVVAATNHKTILDKALFRRFDIVIDYSLPDEQQAIQIIRNRLGTLAKGVKWSYLANEFAGLSHSDLERAAELAAKNVILSGGQTVSVADIRGALQLRRLATNAA